MIRRLSYLILAVLAVSPAAVRAQTDAARNDNAVCSAQAALAGYEHLADVGLRDNVAAVRRQLSGLCASSPDIQSVRAGSEVGWITLADHAVENLVMSLADRLNRPVSAQDRKVLGELLLKTAALHRDFEPTRITAYQVVRIETNVVEKRVEVEVPAQVAAAEPPPPPRDPCADVLRQGAGRWSGQLYKWTDWYRGSGSDYALADSSKSELARLANGSGDPASYVVGWLAQWRNIERRQDTSVLGSGPMSQIAADMHAQLRYCGRDAGER